MSGEKQGWVEKKYEQNNYPVQLPIRSLAYGDGGLLRAVGIIPRRWIDCSLKIPVPALTSFAYSTDYPHPDCQIGSALQPQPLCLPSVCAFHAHISSLRGWPASQTVACSLTWQNEIHTHPLISILFHGLESVTLVLLACG